MSGDSPELEALFDSIVYAPKPELDAVPLPDKQNEDTPELESLFDSITYAVGREEMGGGEEDGVCPERIFSQLGHMTRGLHNLLRELGLDKAIERVTQDLPDNRDRLNYIASMTAQAAERSLNAAEIAKTIQEQQSGSAQRLSGQWDKLFTKQLGVNEFKELVQDTRRYLAEAPQQSAATNAQLMEVIMAQDFQDLTGQVIKKILVAAQQLENQLLNLLIETTPEGKRQSVSSDLLNGPVINSSNRSDVVTSQAQVDDLLESLGF